MNHDSNSSGHIKIQDATPRKNSVIGRTVDCGEGGYEDDDDTNAPRIRSPWRWCSCSDEISEPSTYSYFSLSFELCKIVIAFRLEILLWRVCYNSAAKDGFDVPIAGAIQKSTMRSESCIVESRVVSEILSGERELNIRQIRRLAKRFGVSPAVFIVP